MSRIASALEALFFFTLGVSTPYMGLFLPRFLVEEYAMVGQTLPPVMIIGVTAFTIVSGPCIFAMWTTVNRRPDGKV